MAHETTDASARGVLWAAGILVAAGLVIHAGVRVFEGVLRHLEHAPPSSRSTGPSENVPRPRLQRSPSLDWQQFRAEEESVLQSYGWVDRGAGVIRLPIERALELTAERGLPSRAAARKGAAP